MAKKLLIVVDMQNDFINGTLGTPEALKIVPKVVDKITNWDGDIIYTMDTHFEPSYTESQEGRLLPVPHCIINTNGWEINSDIWTALEEAKKENFVRMQIKTSFGSSDLVKELKENNDEYSCIEFVGLVTDICVVTNALAAKTFLPEISIAVDSSCCAGTTPEMHRAALDVMNSCQIKIL